MVSLFPHCWNVTICFLTCLLHFFFFCVPYSYLWGSPFRVRFLRLFHNPIIEVVTFCLCGWSMLGVFLLLAFTHLGHECWDIRWNACAHRLDLSLYSDPKDFQWNGVRTHVNSKGKYLLYWKNFPQRKIEPTMLHQAGHRAQHTTSELFWPSSSCLSLLFTWSIKLLSLLFTWSCLSLLFTWSSRSDM